MEEINLSKCSECQDIKTRIQDGKYPDGKNKRWVDETGKCWVGRKCPLCVVTSMKGRMQKFRAVQKDV